jgi:hypothetical protein
MAIQKRVDYFGASVAGPAHRVARKLNEDRWLGASGSFGSLIVVSDGLGSKPQARRGAQAACTATLRAVRSWFSEGGGSFEQLLPRIEAFWLEEIAPHDRTDCAATCLMALAHRDGGSYVAALGDGMAALNSLEGPLPSRTRRCRSEGPGPGRVDAMVSLRLMRSFWRPMGSPMICDRIASPISSHG